MDGRDTLNHRCFFSLVLFLLLLAAAQGSRLVGRSGVNTEAAGGWTQEISANGGSDRITGNTVTLYSAFEFVADQDGDLESVTFYALSVGTAGANTFDVEIWTDSAGKPSAMISGATGQFNQSDLTGSYTEQTVDLDTPATISNGTTYYIVFHADQQNSFNYIRTEYDATGGSGWDLHGSNDGTTWGDSDFDAFHRGSISGT